MVPYPLTLGLDMTLFHGHVFIAPDRLYFICSKVGRIRSELRSGTSTVAGEVGRAINAVGATRIGDVVHISDEALLAEAVAANPGSLIMEPAQIEEIKETLWARTLRWNGKKFGLASGLGKWLKLDLGVWAKEHGVVTKGLG